MNFGTETLKRSKSFPFLFRRDASNGVVMLRQGSGRFYTHVFSHAQCPLPWERTCTTPLQQFSRQGAEGSHTNNGFKRVRVLVAEGFNTEEWRKLHNMELNILSSSSNIIRTMKSRNLWWIWLEMKNSCNVLVEKSEKKRSLMETNCWTGAILT